MERPINETYRKLVEALEFYMDTRRKKERAPRAKGQKLKDAAQKFNEVFNSSLSALAGQLGFGDAYHLLPDPLYTDSVIRFALEGLKITHPALSAIWEGYIVIGLETWDVSQHINYSSRSVVLLTKRLPSLIVDQLWDKNRELAGPPYPIISPTTVNQRRIALLTAQWGIERRPAEFLVAFCHPGPERGMRQICQELHLSPTGGGRTYAKLVRKKMKASTLQDSVGMAIALFRQHPEAEWVDEVQISRDGKVGE